MSNINQLVMEKFEKTKRIGGGAIGGGAITSGMGVLHKSGVNNMGNGIINKVMKHSDIMSPKMMGILAASGAITGGAAGRFYHQKRKDINDFKDILKERNKKKK